MSAEVSSSSKQLRRRSLKRENSGRINNNNSSSGNRTSFTNMDSVDRKHLVEWRNSKIFASPEIRDIIKVGIDFIEKDDDVGIRSNDMEKLRYAMQGLSLIHMIKLKYSEDLFLQLKPQCDSYAIFNLP